MSRSSKQGVMKAARHLARGLGILGIGVLLTAAILEVWARAQPRRWFLVFDETLGFRLEPGAKGEYRGRWMLAANPHIRTPVQINSLGMRGPERPGAKTPGMRRLLIMGDSYVQAFEVPWEQTFYALLEDRAQGGGGTGLEPLPMGVNGYGQAQELLWLEQRGVELAPDLVLLVVFLGNDIMDNSRDLGSGSAQPYFDLVDGELVQVAKPDEAARLKYQASRYLRSFILYREIGFRVEALQRVARSIGWVNFPDGHRNDAAPELSERRRAAWDLTAALIDAIAHVARGAGAQFLLAFHGSYPPGSAEAHDRILSFCDEVGLDCLDLSSELEGHDEYFVPDDEHWTARGHQRVADLIWDRWRDLLVGGPPDGEPVSLSTRGFASDGGGGPQHPR